jgi:hypothetical protein
VPDLSTGTLYLVCVTPEHIIRGHLVGRLFRKLFICDSAKLYGAGTRLEVYFVPDCLMRFCNMRASPFDLNFLTVVQIARRVACRIQALNSVAASDGFLIGQSLVYGVSAGASAHSGVDGSSV